MKRIISCLVLLAMLFSSSFSAFATGISDIYSQLADYAGDAQYSTTQSFLNALNKYSVPYTFLGKIGDSNEYVRINNYDSANDLSYTLNAAFSPDSSSVTITVLNFLSFNPDSYSTVMDICTAIYADYGKMLFVPSEESNAISFAYVLDLSECENAGIQTLAIIMDIADIIATEYSRFAPIIHNEAEIENTSTPQPTMTPEPTPIPTPEPTSTPSPTEIPDSVIVARAEEIYELVNRNGRLWPADYALAQAAGVHSVRDINVSSCDIGFRSTSYDIGSSSISYSTVLFKGNFSGYDEYGMFVSKYTFTAEVQCTIKDGYIDDIDFVRANYKVSGA